MVSHINPVQLEAQTISLTLIHILAEKNVNQESLLGVVKARSLVVTAVVLCSWSFEFESMRPLCS